MRVYYAAKLSPNISRMPNGFLVCKNVPVARTGTQEYLGGELGIEGLEEDKLYDIVREESEVFSPATLASFEGAAFVDEHPSGDVTVSNAQFLTRGFVKDVRRGEGEDADKILADIIVTDPVIIAAIEEGKREISCGYKCRYEQGEDGTIYQRDIRGNHVALVGAGRAGADVAIKDHKPEITKNGKEQQNMTRSATKKPLGVLAKFFANVKDEANPEEIAEIVEELTAAKAAEDEDEPAKKAEPKGDEAAKDPAKTEDADEEPVWVKAILERLGRVEEALSKSTDEDPLEELEKELVGNNEENNTVPAEEIISDEDADKKKEDEAEDDEAEDDEAGLDDGEDDPKSEAKDKALRKAVRDAKKVVAAIKDAKTRKSVADSMAKMIRSSYGIKPSTPKGSYAAINAVKRGQAAKAKDARNGIKPVSFEARQKAYDARNPHITKKD